LSVESFHPNGTSRWLLVSTADLRLLLLVVETVGVVLAEKPHWSAEGHNVVVIIVVVTLVVITSSTLDVAEGFLGGASDDLDTLAGLAEETRAFHEHLVTATGRHLLTAVIHAGVVQLSGVAEIASALVGDDFLGVSRAVVEITRHGSLAIRLGFVVTVAVVA